MNIENLEKELLEFVESFIKNNEQCKGLKYGLPINPFIMKRKIKEIFQRSKLNRFTEWLKMVLYKLDKSHFQEKEIKVKCPSCKSLANIIKQCVGYYCTYCRKRFVYETGQQKLKV